MIKTYGLTHIALAVKDAERSFRFYHDVFGAKATYRRKDVYNLKHLDAVM